MPKRRQAADASRRNFLKGAGLVGAAAAVTPPVAANAMPAAPWRNSRPRFPARCRSRPRPCRRRPIRSIRRRAAATSWSTCSIRSASSTWRSIALRAIAACTKPSSITATTSPKSSPACTRTSPSTWRRAMPRSKASRWRWRATASSVCSTPPWRCTTPGAIACRSWCGRQHHGGGQARARRRMGACRRRYRPDRARIHQVGRPAGVVAAFRRV